MANPSKSTEADSLRVYREQQLPECNPTVEDLAKVYEAQDKATLEIKLARLEAQEPALFAYILSRAGTGEAKRRK